MVTCSLGFRTMFSPLVPMHGNPMVDAGSVEKYNGLVK
jgi:hypothetical protein